MPRKRRDIPPELRDADRGLRLQKAMAEAGVASRRACEQMIEEGRVTVNGQAVTDLPAWVDPASDHIAVDGKPVARKKRELGKLYLMVYKPRGVISTNRDPEGRKRVIDLVPHGQRLFCVGRLDSDSTGFVLLTNDGELTQKLTHPSHEVPKTYHVRIKGELTGDEVEKLTEGIYLADRSGKTARAAASKVKLVSRDRDRTVLEITLREGRNREIRRMLARLGHPVRRLKRIAIGPVKLKGVAMGEWRDLTRQELNALRKAAHEPRP